MNMMKTAFLMAALTGLLMLVGRFIGGQNGMIIAFVLAAGMNFFSYWYSDKVVLMMYRAQEVSEAEAPELVRIVRKLAQRDGLPMPKVYVIPDGSPNAFATGRDPQHAAVAATAGILNLLSEDELEGVFAHELTHVKNRDILIASIAATIASAITMLRFVAFFGGGGGRDDEERGGNALGFLFMLILAPVAAMLIQMAISRSREYAADAGGGKLTGHPMSLAHALQKLHRGVELRPMDANPSTAHMFIVHPFSGGLLASLFSTHPSMEDRVARLSEQAHAMGVE